jgi:hypothetical protein
MIQFPVYELLKEEFVKKDEKPALYQICGITITSKILSSSVSYPHEVLRSKLQKANFESETRFTGLLSCGQWIFKEEGVAGFYAGFAANLVRILPAAIATFVVYEHVIHYLQDKKR